MIPRIREKLSVLSFDLEASEKVMAVKQDLRLVLGALSELKSPKVKRIIEVHHSSLSISI
jgi:hypothetical protein